MCPWSSKLDAFYDGELSPDESRELAQHLPSCSPCSRNLRQIAQLSRSLSALRSDSIRPGDIAMQRWRQTVRNTQRTHAILRLARFVSGVAAAIVAGGSLWLFTHPATSPINAHVAAAAADNWEQTAITLAYEPRVTAPAEVELAEWIARDLDFAHAATPPSSNNDIDIDLENINNDDDDTELIDGIGDLELEGELR